MVSTVSFGLSSKIGYSKSFRIIFVQLSFFKRSFFTDIRQCGVVCLISSGTNKWHPIFLWQQSSRFSSVQNKKNNATPKYVYFDCMMLICYFIKWVNFNYEIRCFCFIFYLCAPNRNGFCQSPTELNYLWVLFDQKEKMTTTKIYMLNWIKMEERVRQQTQWQWRWLQLMVCLCFNSKHRTKWFI